MAMQFDRRISVGNIATIASMVAIAAAQWGAFQKTVTDIERRITEHDSILSEMRKDSRVGEAQARIAVIENNVLWIRSDVADIKAQLKKGAE